MGPAGLTAVFGMGTGGTPPVSSPESAGGGGQASTGPELDAVVRREKNQPGDEVKGSRSVAVHPRPRSPSGADHLWGRWIAGWDFLWRATAGGSPGRAFEVKDRWRVGVVKLLGC